MLTACGAATAPADKAAKQSQATQRYAIAGISPGMSSLAVASAAGRAGYQLVSESKGHDWAEALKRAVDGNRLDFNAAHRGIRDQEYRRGGERISVSYLPMPSGSLAALITYSAPEGVLNFAKAEAELIKRYGRKSFGHQAGAPWSTWCAKEAQTARDCLRFARLSVEKNNSGISMTTDDPALKAQQAELFRKHSGAKASF